MGKLPYIKECSYCGGKIVTNIKTQKFCSRSHAALSRSPRRPLSVLKHDTIGKYLKGTRLTLRKFSVEINECYGDRSLEKTQIEKVIKAIDVLRGYMQETANEETKTNNLFYF